MLELPQVQRKALFCCVVLCEPDTIVIAASTLASEETGAERPWSLSRSPS